MSRRVIDSLTPGWRQIGAVWLPLPHLLQLLPTQVDWFYRTGAFGSLLSISCLALTVWAFTHIVLRLTGSIAGAVTATALLLLNPNLLYLFVTPMTEPLLVAAVALTVLWTLDWLYEPAAAVPRRLGIALFAAAWTRYEAWPVIATLCLVVALARRRALAYATCPAAAVLLFVINSRLSTGAWFVSGGFYVPDPMYAGRPVIDAIGVWWGANELSTPLLRALRGTSLSHPLHGAARRGLCLAVRNRRGIAGAPDGDAPRSRKETGQPRRGVCRCPGGALAPRVAAMESASPAHRGSQVGCPR